MRFGFGVAVSLMVWLAVCFCWSRPSHRLDGLHAAVMPVGAIASLVPMLFPSDHVLANATSPAFRAHFVVAMLAYSLFHPGRPARHADVGGRAPAARRTLQPPALRPAAPLTMEALLFRLISIAFVLLTLTLASGVLFSETCSARPSGRSCKTVFASSPGSSAACWWAAASRGGAAGWRCAGPWPVSSR